MNRKYRSVGQDPNVQGSAVVLCGICSCLHLNGAGTCSADLRTILKCNMKFVSARPVTVPSMGCRLREDREIEDSSSRAATPLKNPLISNDW
jgi:hypothetical protein